MAIETGVGVAATSCAFATVICTILAPIGLDVNSLGAALAGCVVAQTLLRTEPVSVRSIFLVTLGSMIFASLGAPWFYPVLATMAPATMSHEHILACTAALLAAFSQPMLLIIKAGALRFMRAWKGASDVA